MQALSSALEAEIETRDAKQVIELAVGKVTFHPDDRGFAFITGKNLDQETIAIVEELQQTYSSIE